MGNTFESYLDIMAAISPLSSESKAALSTHLSTKRFEKGELILKQGDICRHLFFLDRGLVRIFYYKNSKEITEWFADEKEFFFSIISFFELSPSKLIIEALEESEVILLSKDGQDRLSLTNIEIANLISRLYALSLILSQKRMQSMQFESSSRRYENLLKEQPNLLKKVSLQHLASFLGITQETLSRIRSNT